MKKGMLLMNKQSRWAKWDLHVHTPLSIVQHYGGDTEEIWNKFISDLESLPSEFEVIGINDYLFIDGYKKVLEYKKNGRLKNIRLIIPVVEFRLSEFAGVNFGIYKRPNLHVIFADAELLSTDLIESQFLSTLSAKCVLEKGGHEYNRTITKDSLLVLGKQIIESSPEKEQHRFKSPMIEGFNNLNFSLSKIQGSLNKDCFDGKYLLALGKTEWSDMKWSDSSIASKKNLINSCHIVFTSSKSVEECLVAKKNLKEQEVNDLLLDCSDAHSFSNSIDENGNSIKDRVGKCFTWIKAEPTFEGLKQILYEPKNRVAIQDNQPIEPINKVNSIKLNFPQQQDDNQDFCYAGVTKEIELSPYYNCFIGGRGTGKSTLLGLLGRKAINAEDNEEYWQQRFKHIPKEVAEDFNISGTTKFEYLGQNQIEQFASDEKAFTKAIYARANEMSGGKLAEFEDRILGLHDKINLSIRYIEDVVKYREQKEKASEKLKIIESNKSILANEEFKDIVENIKKQTSIVNQINLYNEKLGQLKEQIEGLTREYDLEISTETEAIIEYKNIFKSIGTKLHKLLTEIDDFNNSRDKEKENNISKNINIQKEQLKTLLTNAGLSKENIIQAQNIAEEEQNLQGRLKELEKNISSIGNEFSLLDKEVNADESRKKYEGKLEEVLKPLQERLDKEFDNNSGENIKKISFSYEFNKKEAWQNIAKDFYLTMRSLDEKNNERGQEHDVCRFITENVNDCFDLDEYEHLLKKLNEIAGNLNDSNYLKYVQSCFNKKANFYIFKKIQQRHLSNVKEYSIIKVAYNGKDIKNASFGQKCTAVIVILMIFGTYPLIIDEPEAHLDSGLIANYLVPLIKEQKNHRQIIFATHNANFVINGDAEKIFILKNETGQTQITETTIENLENREALLELEGGKEAFRKRGKKLHI